MLKNKFKIRNKAQNPKFKTNAGDGDEKIFSRRAAEHAGF
jgi:hypothetical protein